MSNKKMEHCYVGYSHECNVEGCADYGKTGMFPYKESCLCRQNYPAEVTGWKMTPERLHILFDFCQNVEIDRAVITMREVPAKENEIWGNGEINVNYREEDGKYYTVGKLYPKKDKLMFEVPFCRKARFVQLVIKRSPWRQYPMPLVEFYGIDSNCMPTDVIDKENMTREFKKEAAQIDKYGQAIYCDWPGKVVSDDMLRHNLEVEAEKLKSVKQDLEHFDQYGGVKNYKALEATGFFRVEKIDGVWWFVTPEGNPFIMKGMDLVTYSEMSYHSPIYVKGSKDVVRGVFAELPDRQEFADAYEKSIEGHDVVNHLRANLQRKYGKNFDKKWAEVTEKRLLDWGFNAIAKWEIHPDIKNFPYIKSLNSCDGFKKIGWLIDPYAPDFEQNVENSVKDILPQYSDDPMLIGYHYTNESGLDRVLIADMLQKNAECSMKCAFVDFILQHMIHSDVVEKFGTIERSLLIQQPMKIDMIPKSIVCQFITATAKKYYKTIRDMIKKYDPNHLFLGTALTPEWRSTYDWNIGGLEYLDVLSFDHYCRTSNKWFYEYIKFDIPMINIEFSFTASDRGLSPIFDCIHCDSQEERGKEYKDFMEYYFQFPQFVGSGFFILYDQTMGGRCNPDGGYGECHNFGIIDTTDEPYYECIKYMKQAHEGLENIHAGKQIV